MVEDPGVSGVTIDPGVRQLGEVVDRVTRRFADRTSVHRDVIEAAVRSGWAKYDGAPVTTYRAILAERAAIAALQQWFGDPRPASSVDIAETSTQVDSRPRGRTVQRDAACAAGRPM